MKADYVSRLIHDGAWCDVSTTATSFAEAEIALIQSSGCSGAIDGMASLNYRLSPWNRLPTSPSNPDHAFRQARHPDHLDDTLSADELTAQTIDIVLYLVCLAVAEFVLVSLSTSGFIWTGERLSCRVREEFLEACRRQNIGFHDGLGVGGLTTRIINDINLIQEDISEKLALMVAAAATFVSAFVVGFVVYWKLTLVAVVGGGGHHLYYGCGLALGGQV